MKKLIFLLAFIAAAHFSSQAQIFKWGVKVGLSTPDVKPKDLTEIKLKAATDSFRLKVADANYGFHFGVWSRLSAGKFFIQPELNLNSSKVSYNFKNLKLSSAADSLGSEKFLNLDIPVLIGFKLGGIRFNGGPVGHLHLNSSSDLKSAISGYKESFKQMQFGYQAGIGVNFGAAGIDIRYEGNFDKFGDHITFGGNTYEFNKAPSRFLVSLQIGF